MAAEIVAARQALEQQIGTIEARLQALGANEIAAALDEAERRETAARHDADARRAVFQQACEAHRSHRDAIETARQNLRDLEIRATALETNHGDTSTRERALETALEAETAAKTALDATLKLLAELNPAQLRADQR